MDASPPLDLQTSTFTVANLYSGASDALGRIALVYDVFTTAANISFVLPEYSNYHARDLDFLQIFGLREAFPPPSFAPSEIVHLSFDHLVDALLGAGLHLTNGCHYVVDGREAYGQHPALARFRQSHSLRRTFHSFMQYRPTSSVFDLNNGNVKVVIHLRRNDICGEALFGGLPESDLPPESIRRGIQPRPLLTIKHAVSFLEEQYAKGSTLDIVLLSDGVQSLQRRFRNYPAVSARISLLQQELAEPLESCTLNLHEVDRIVGNDAVSTIRSLDAIYNADITLTRSSSFVLLLATIAKKRYFKC